MGAYDLGIGLLDGFVKYRGYSADPFSSLEDFSDRLNHIYSTLIILILAGVTMTNVYFLRPISCTLPTQPDSHFTTFAESLCWVQGTIGLNSDDPLPNDALDWANLKERSDISFYQWVPFCLSIQALLFYIPHLFWQALSTSSLGDNLECLLTRAKRANQADDHQIRENFVNTCADHLFQISRQHADIRKNKWSKMQRNLSRVPGVNLFVVGKRMGNRISFVYVIVKLLYIVNAYGQLFMIIKFLGHESYDFLSFAQHLFNVFKSRREWGGSEFFPMQTLCPVKVPHLGVRNQVYTAICALPVNMFNEKIYIFLWIWISAVATVTSMSLVIWFLRLVRQKYSRNLLREFLAISILAPIKDNTTANQRSAEFTLEDVDLFLREVVRCDGNFIIRMLRLNAGDVVTGEILARWWKIFRDEEERLQQLANDNGLKQGYWEHLDVYPSAPEALPVSNANSTSTSRRNIMRPENIV